MVSLAHTYMAAEYEALLEDPADEITAQHHSPRSIG